MAPGTGSVRGMLDRFKGFWQGVVLMPFVKLFIKWGVSPDTVTLVGTDPQGLPASASLVAGSLTPGRWELTRFTPIASAAKPGTLGLMAGAIGMLVWFRRRTRP